MPTYEYLCKSCSHRFEQWQRMTDEPLVTCPECGGYIRRVFYPAGIVFKGSGFYKTDSSVAASNGHTKKSEDGRHPNGNAPTDATSESKSTGESKSASTESASSSTGASSSENKVAAPTK